MYVIRLLTAGAVSKALDVSEGASDLHTVLYGPRSFRMLWPHITAVANIIVIDLKMFVVIHYFSLFIWDVMVPSKFEIALSILGAMKRCLYSLVAGLTGLLS